MLSDLRTTEFARLDRAGLAYLDYTGAALYSERQVRRHSARLAEGVFGNPHSESAPARASTDVIDAARARVLDFLDADAAVYTVIFTANCSAAIKLVAESYPFGRWDTLLLSSDNHNSANGIREYARRAHARVAYLPLDAELRLVAPDASFAEATRRGNRLFVFPAQSNFSGVQHPLRLIEIAQRHGFHVLLDAASFVPSNRLSLRDHQPDFVALSFYKVFGLPTGIGALVAKRSVLARLRRPWFAGGTVDYVSVQNGIHQLHGGSTAFEDGTPNFLDIAALADGFAFLADVGVERIHEHVGRLTARLLARLRDLPVVVYGPPDGWMRGGTVAFNVLDRHQCVIPYAVIERAARDAGIAIRGGCFCNPGAAEAAFEFDAVKARSCMTSAGAAFSIERLGACLGTDTPVGALRASTGLANNECDIDRLVDLVRTVGAETRQP